MEVVMEPYKDVYKDRQKKAEQPTITFFFTNSSVSSSAMHSVIQSP
jgi:hypothetical protein